MSHLCVNMFMYIAHTQAWVQLEMSGVSCWEIATYEGLKFISMQIMQKIIESANRTFIML